MKRLILLLFIISILFACSSNKNLSKIPAARKMKMANKYFEKGDYKEAIEIYKNIIFERRSKYTADAQLKLADCYFEQENWIDARLEYEEMLKLFPEHSRTGKAQLNIGICYYEESLPAHYTQEETYKAIDAFKAFLDNYPAHSKREVAMDYLKKCNKKLLEKKFINGKIYYKTYDYSGALMYLQEVISENMKNEIDKKAYFYSAKIYFKRENVDKLQNLYERMKLKYPQQEETFEVKELLEELK